nr:NSP2 [Guaico Culex virus]
MPNLTPSTPVLGVVYHHNAFLTTMILFITYLIADVFGVFMFPLTINYCFLQLVWPAQRPERKNATIFLTSLLCLLGLSHLAIFLNLYCVSYAQDKMQREYRSVMEVLYLGLESLAGKMPAIAFPRFGANSSIFEPLLAQLQINLETVNDSISDIYAKLMLDVQTNATFLRPAMINQNIVSIAEKPAVPAVKINELVRDAQTLLRRGIILIAFLVAFFISYIPSFVVCMIVFFAYQFVESDVKSTVDLGARSAPIKNGVYRIDNSIARWQVSHGIGVVWGNVMHIPYHVCYARNIRIGASLYKPYTIDPAKDLVTYNGPPQFSNLPIDSVVYVNCENELSSTTYELPINVDTTTSMITWAGVTSPGESGSPVFSQKEDGEISLVGLAGRYYMDCSGSSTEFSEIPPTLEVEESSNYHRITSHPGSGKTRRIIPDIITKCLTDDPTRRVLVTGPTRVVCKELYYALSGKFSVGLNIKDQQVFKNMHARVQIAAHASMMSMILSNSKETHNVGTLIIDEAHVDDASTYMLRQYGQDMLKHGKTLYELSATLDGESDSRSNYPITDKRITQNEIISTIERSLIAGKRTLVFVPGLKNKVALTLSRNFNAFNPIHLSRETYHNTAPLLLDETRLLIITTNIAECGINIPSLQVVVDLGTVFTYFEDNHTVFSRTSIATEASVVQRRGRVGRERPGEYYSMYDGITYPTKTAAKHDADVMMTGRAWAPSISNDWNMKLSDNQVLTSLQKGLIPAQVFLTTDTKGTRLPENIIVDRIKRLKMSYPMISYCGCGDPSCQCAGEYAWFDVRIHDLLVGKRVNLPKLIVPM